MDSETMDLMAHQSPAPDVTKRAEAHIKVRWERYWQDLAMFESKKRPDPAGHLFYLRMRYRKRLRELKDAGIHDHVIRRYGLDDPRPSDIDFSLALADAKQRREIILAREQRKRKRHADRIGNSTEQGPIRQRTEADTD